MTFNTHDEMIAEFKANLPLILEGRDPFDGRFRGDEKLKQVKTRIRHEDFDWLVATAAEREITLDELVCIAVEFFRFNKG